MKKNGITLVELLIVIALGALIMAAIYAAMTMAQRTSTGLGRKIITQQDTRAVLGFMASEIRMASFNPSMTGTLWTGMPTDVTSCTRVTSIVGSITYNAANRGIIFANANNLYIAMDISAEATIGVCTCGDPDDCADPDEACANRNEYIFYSYNSGNRAITRSVSCSPNIQILGGTLEGSNVINGDSRYPTPIPLFQYYNRAGTELTGTIDIPAIRRIKINIATETTEIDPLTGQRKVMIYTTDVLVRNHAVFQPQS